MTKARGFTLLEVMVVMLIVGVMAGLAVIGGNLSGGADRVGEDARRLLALAEFARDEAILTAEPIGLGITRGGYRFLGRERVAAATYEWQVLEPDGELRPRRFSHPDVELELAVEGVPVALPGPEAMPAPQIYFDATGIVTPFQLRLADPDILAEAYALRSASGRLSLVRE